MAHVCEDEHQLFFHFFSQPTEGLEWVFKKKYLWLTDLFAWFDKLFTFTFIAVTLKMADSLAEFLLEVKFVIIMYIFGRFCVYFLNKYGLTLLKSLKDAMQTFHKW